MIQDKLREAKDFLSKPELGKWVERLREEQEPVTEGEFRVHNLNQKMDNCHKSLLLVQNVHKTDLLELLNGLLFFLQKLLMLPISLGFVLGEASLSYVIIGVILFAIQLRRSDSIREVNLLNFVLAFLTLYDYLQLYMRNFRAPDSSFESGALSQSNQVYVLLYMFSYASLFKFFFMACLMICY